jgi:hypothetical protein
MKRWYSIEGPRQKELSMVPSPGEILAARRVLEAIGKHAAVTQADAFAVRMWYESIIRMRTLEEIAREVLKAAGKPHMHT